MCLYLGLRPLRCFLQILKECCNLPSHLKYNWFGPGNTISARAAETSLKCPHWSWALHLSYRHPFAIFHLHSIFLTWNEKSKSELSAYVFCHLTTCQWTRKKTQTFLVLLVVYTNENKFLVSLTFLESSNLIWRLIFPVCILSGLFHTFPVIDSASYFLSLVNLFFMLELIRNIHGSSSSFSSLWLVLFKTLELSSHS